MKNLIFLSVTILLFSGCVFDHECKCTYVADPAYYPAGTADITEYNTEANSSPFGNQYKCTAGAEDKYKNQHYTGNCSME